MRMIYFDNAATTKMFPEVVDILKFSMDKGSTMWMNPSSAYMTDSMSSIEKARNIILSCIGADENDHIIFTSGGSEANSMVTHSFMHVETTPIEHDSVLLADNLTIIDGIDGKGFFNLPEKMNLDATPNRVFSIQLANNEIGTIQDIKSIREMFPDKIIHTDAVQAIGHIPVNVKDLGVDLLSASAHKFGGPKGIGFLYVNKRVYDKINPLINGTQENGKRGSTYNLPSIIGMAKALKISVDKMFDYSVQTVKVRNEIINCMEQIPCAHLNGTEDFIRRLPGNLNYRFDGYRGEQLQEYLAEHEIYVSTGSACNTSSGKPSHVLKAIGLTDDESDSSIRITVNHENTEQEALAFINALKDGLRLLA